MPPEVSCFRESDFILRMIVGFSSETEKEEEINLQDMGLAPCSEFCAQDLCSVLDIDDIVVKHVEDRISEHP